MHAKVYIFIVSGLLCHCDICADRNDTCVTDGYCFTSTSLQKDTGVVTHAYRWVIVMSFLLYFTKFTLLLNEFIKNRVLTM